MSKENEIPLSLSAAAARNLATATVTVPQYTEITPRWLHKLLPWVDVDGGVYRVNRVAKAPKGEAANEFGEVKVDLLTVEGGEPKLPTTFVDYDVDPREYHLSTIQTVLRTHTRVTDLYSNKIDQLREQIRLTVEAVKEREEWELINSPDFGLLEEVAEAQTLKTRKGLDWTAKYPEIAKAAAALPDCIVDGEICALDDNGAPDFAALQAALSERNTGTAWRCMLEPMSARLASSCSRNGIKAAATDTT